MEFMSGCDVCIGGGDYDGVLEFQEVSHPKARKDHKCEECRAVIPVGQKYQKIVGKVDGDFTETKTCLMCAEIREVFACGEITVLGELWEDFRNAEVFERLTTASECFTKLSPPAKSFLLDRWRKWKGLQSANAVNPQPVETPEESANT